MSMDVTYYPGCSLESTARDYDESTRAVCHELGIILNELEDWTCCGATSAHCLDEELAISLPGLNLDIAEKKGLDMLVPCPLCFNRLKRAREKQGQKVEIHDLAEFLSQKQWLSQMESKIKYDLGKMKAVCYYGCMANRPPKVTGGKDYENPCNMDNIAKTLGIDVKPWSYKTDCCGASFAVSREDILHTLVKKLYDHALEAGAECIIVSCQMCQANLDMYQEEISAHFGQKYNIPIFYITEIIALVLGIKGSYRWLGRHITDPVPYLNMLKS